MKVSFSKEVGRLYDLFASIMVALNSDEYFKEVSKYNIPEDKLFKEALEEVRSLLGHELPKYLKTFHFNSNVGFSLIHTDKMWYCKDLEEYLEYIEALDEYEIQKYIIALIDYHGEEWIQIKDEERIKEMIKDKSMLYKYLEEKPISDEEKWRIFSIINDIEGYKKDFIRLIKEYSLKYEKLYKKHEKEIEDFALAIEEEINKKGIDIDIPINQFVDIKNINSLFIIPSYFHAYTLSQNRVTKKGESYLIIGKNIEQIFQGTNREASMERNITIFKNLGDLNRYTFIKLLSEGEKYGQEITEALGITSATVSYHANNLLIAGLITMERHENKTYYSLNKESLRQMIDFIKKDLNI